MVFLLEEIAVEVVAIFATLVAAGLLVAVLVGFALERRALRATAPFGSGAQDAQVAERRAPTTSTFTPSRS